MQAQRRNDCKLVADSAAMRTMLTILTGLAAALVLAAALLFALAVDGAARVPPREEVSVDDIDRAETLLRQHDPRRLPYGQLRALTLSEADLDLLVLHAARRWLGAATSVQLRDGALTLQASFAAPLGRWLNLELTLRQTAALPELDKLKVGRLPLPAALAMPTVRWLAARRGVHADALLELNAVERVALLPESLVLSYRIAPDTTARLRTALVAPDEQQRLRIYHDRLATLTQAMPAHSTSLARLLPPLFTLAAQRSAAGADAALENRAALKVLTFFAVHRELGQLLPAAYDWPLPRPMVVTLRQRPDWAMHFMVSAMLAAEAGTPLADSAGLWKELSDARGDSGFSFDDLAADRAGTRLGELAVRDAARLQSRIAAGVVDAQLLPPLADLPSQLSQRQFVARYGAVGSTAYNRVLAEIDARIETLALLH